MSKKTKSVVQLTSKEKKKAKSLCKAFVVKTQNPPIIEPRLVSLSSCLLPRWSLCLLAFSLVGLFAFLPFCLLAFSLVGLFVFLPSPSEFCRPKGLTSPSSSSLFFKTMESKKPLSDYPPPPSAQSEKESAKEQDEESGEVCLEQESASEHEEESGEEESSEGEESKFEEDINESKAAHAKPQSQLNKMSDPRKQVVTPPQSPSSDSGEEEEKKDDEVGDDEESENSPHSLSASDFITKFTTSKDSKCTSKRPLEDQKYDEKDLRSEKKAKGTADEQKKDKPSTIPAASGEGSGKVYWNDDDVICLLECIIDFKGEKGIDPPTHMNAFCEFARGKFPSKFSRTQIYKKIRGLRTKFSKKLEKGGEDPTLLKGKEFEVFKLSKKIWGGGTSDGLIASGAGKNALKDFNHDDDGDFESKYPLLIESLDLDLGGAGERSFLKDNICLIGDEKAKYLEGKWKKLHAEIFLKRLDLIKEQTNLFLEAIKKK